MAEKSKAEEAEKARDEVMRLVRDIRLSLIRLEHRALVPPLPRRG